MKKFKMFDQISYRLCDFYQEFFLSRTSYNAFPLPTLTRNKSHNRTIKALAKNQD